MKPMTKKVKLAVFDRDLKARQYGNFEVTDDGSKIRVRTGGKRNFNPTFDNDSFVEFPRRSFLPPFKTTWDRVYFARNGAKACVRFRQMPNDLKDKIKSLADLEELIQAAKNGNPEAQYQLNQVVKVLETAGTDDFLKPDPELVLEMARNEIARGIGAEETKPTPIILYAILGVVVLILLKVLGVIA